MGGMGVRGGRAGTEARGPDKTALRLRRIIQLVPRRPYTRDELRRLVAQCRIALFGWLDFPLTGQIQCRVVSRVNSPAHALIYVQRAAEQLRHFLVGVIFWIA